MKKNSKTVLALITGILFLTLATIPVTLFSQTVQQKEGRAVWLHASIFEDEEKEATQHLKELLNMILMVFTWTIFVFPSTRDLVMIKPLVNLLKRNTVILPLR